MGQFQFVEESCCCKKQSIPAYRSVEVDAERSNLSRSVFDEECIRIADRDGVTVLDLDEVTIHDVEEVRLMMEKASNLRMRQVQTLADSLQPDTSTEFVVQCTKGGYAKLGLDVEWGDGSTLMIRRVLPGPAENWNLQNPHKKLEAGDIITSINNVTGNVSKLLEEIQSDKIVMIVKKAVGNLPSATNLGAVAEKCRTTWSTRSDMNKVVMSNQSTASDSYLATGDQALIREARLDDVLFSPKLEQEPAEAVCPSTSTSSKVNEYRAMKTSSSIAEREAVKRKETTPNNSMFALLSCLCPCAPLNLSKPRPVCPPVNASIGAAVTLSNSVGEMEELKRQERIPKRVPRTFLSAFAPVNHTERYLTCKERRGNVYSNQIQASHSLGHL